jgi:hypothetical protein
MEGSNSDSSIPKITLLSAEKSNLTTWDPSLIHHVRYKFGMFGHCLEFDIEPECMAVSNISNNNNSGSATGPSSTRSNKGNSALVLNTDSNVMVTGNNVLNDADRQNERNFYMNNKFKVFETILLSLDPELIKSVEHDERFRQIKKDVDYRGLYKLIKTLYNDLTIGDYEEQLIEVINKCINDKYFSDTSIAEHISKFKDYIKIVEDVKIFDMTSPKIISWFIKIFQNTINDIDYKAKIDYLGENKPKTLILAYKDAKEHFDMKAREKAKLNTNNNNKSEPAPIMKFSNENNKNKNNNNETETGKEWCIIHKHCNHSTDKCELVKECTSEKEKEYQNKKQKFKNNNNKNSSYGIFKFYATEIDTSKKKLCITFDSAAGVSVTNNKLKRLTKIHNNNNQLVSVTGEKIQSNQSGTWPGLGQFVIVKEARENILSMNSILEQNHMGIRYSDSDNTFIITDNEIHKQITFAYDSTDGLFKHYLSDNGELMYEDIELKVNVINTLKTCYTKKEIARAIEIRTLHAAYGHICDSLLYKTALKLSVNGLVLTHDDIVKSNKILGNCGICDEAKFQQRKMASPVDRQPICIGDILEMDIAYFTSKGFELIILIAIDRFSGLISTVEIKSKRQKDIIDGINDIIENIYHVHNHTVRTIVFDNEKGTIAAFNGARIAKGVELINTGPNGHATTVERAIESVKERFRAVFLAFERGRKEKLREKYWNYLVAFVVTGLNCSANSNSDITPYEQFTGHKPTCDKAYTIPFGCIINIIIPYSNNHKTTEPRGQRAMMLGRVMGSKDMILAVPVDTRDNNREQLVIKSNLYKIDENEQNLLILLGSKVNIDNITSLEEITTLDPNADVFTPNNNNIVNNNNNITLNNNNSNINHNDNIIVDISTDNNNIISNNDSNVTNIINNNNNNNIVEIASDNIINNTNNNVNTEKSDNNVDNRPFIEVKRRKKNKKKKAVINDNNITINTNNNNNNNNDNVNITTTTTNINNKSHNYNTRDPSKKVFSISIKEAMKINKEDTLNAIQKEIMNMIKFKVFHPVTMNYNQIKGKIVPSFLFMKEKLTGMKARLLANGKLEWMSEYDYTNSPTIFTNTFMTGLAVANSRGYKIASADIDAAYLQSIGLDKELYMILNKEITEQLLSNPGVDPEWKNFVRKDGTMMVKLDKGIYGLKESARLWNHTLTGVFKDLGFNTCEADECLLSKGDLTGVIHVYIHVDDILFTYSSDALYKSTIASLEVKFGKLKIQEGNTIKYLGLEINKCDNGDLTVNMNKFINKLLTEYDISSGENIPANNNIYESNGNSINTTKYKSLVAKLMYLATKLRYDILFSISFLATKSAEPSESDWNSLIKVLRYIYDTKDKPLIFKSDENINNINVYVDAAHANHADSMGHSGYIIYLGDRKAGIYARAIKQRINADASYDAELIALNEAVKTTEHIALVLKHLDSRLKSSITIHEDNLPAITTILDKKACTTRSKAVNNRVQCCKARMKSYNMQIKHCPTEDMIADALTKVLPEKSFIRYRNLMLN